MSIQTPEGAKERRNAHIWDRDAEDHYVEPQWVSDALFRVETFTGPIHDPAAGFGRIPDAARRAGYDATAADIVDRGDPGTQIMDFLRRREPVQSIICNPPFWHTREFAERACELAKAKAAILFPLRRLPAAGPWLSQLPLKRIWMLSPRPSMPPGHVALEYAARGQEPSGGTAEFCWLVFERHCRTPPSVAWLHRDRGKI